MKIEEAIRLSIKKYFEDYEPKEFKGVAGSRANKYTKKYFDEVSQEFELNANEKESPENGEFGPVLDNE